ncbi:MAG: 23S rRNA (uracil(1939)-C(5))-methyltransferase RlmD [Clostridiales bacterium]|jgi:23S rRNA (uracil1939-C5)-methyltransferase|nr:23S rRNA (uracil(1939)-C(5))-methyltransferase RlmD [Clostridiales bacterium]
MLKKNDVIQLRIDAVGSACEGVGRADGMAVFVEQGLPGDLLTARIVKLKKTYAYAKLLEILEPSEARVTPICPAFAQCGGCTLQHCAYPAQTRLKQQTAANALERIGRCQNFTMLDILGAEEPFHYRNKAQFPVKMSDGGPVAGFFAARSHRVVPIDSCPLQDPVNDEILRVMKQYIWDTGVTPYDEITHTGLLRHIVTRVGRAAVDTTVSAAVGTAVDTAVSEVMICLVINGKKIPQPDALIRRLKSQIPGMKTLALNENFERGNAIFGSKTQILDGPGVIYDRIGDLRFAISPGSFYQVNAAQTRKLYDTVLTFASLTGRETVLDAYCGIGTIALYLARHARKVYGVEISREAVRDAQNNAALNGIANVEFTAGAAEETAPQLLETGGAAFDLAVVDPPRKGCNPLLLRSILRTPPRQLIYVSCDPATLARDIAILTKGGYCLDKVRPVDMFPQTCHVECVANLFYI